MSDKYYLPGDQLMSFVCREGTLSIVRVKEIINNNNKKNITVNKMRLELLPPPIPMTH